MQLLHPAPLQSDLEPVARAFLAKGKVGHEAVNKADAVVDQPMIQLPTQHELRRKAARAVGRQRHRIAAFVTLTLREHDRTRIGVV